MAQPQQCRQDPENCAKDTAACSRGRSDRSHPPLAGGPLDRCPSCPHNILRAIPRRAGAQEPKIPRRIATRTTKPLLFTMKMLSRNRPLPSMLIRTPRAATSPSGPRPTQVKPSGANERAYLCHTRVAVCRPARTGSFGVSAHAAELHAASPVAAGEGVLHHQTDPRIVPEGREKVRANHQPEEPAQTGQTA